MTHCFYHPDQLATRKCQACAKALCDSCTFRTHYDKLIFSYTRYLCPECFVKYYSNQKYKILGVFGGTYFLTFIAIIFSDIYQKGLFLGLLGSTFLVVAIVSIFLNYLKLKTAKLRIEGIHKPKII